MEVDWERDPYRVYKPTAWQRFAAVSLESLYSMEVISWILNSNKKLGPLFPYKKS
jgi:hypothetical protein